jgi:hypothetical protein
MIERCLSVTILAVLLIAGAVHAQQYPLLDMAADKVIQKYESATCEQLWQKKGQPKGERQQEFIRLMHEDAQARQYFINKVAAPIANKMFECAMIP